MEENRGTIRKGEGVMDCPDPCSIAIREEELFDRWRKSLPPPVRPSFVTDGIVSPEAYDAAERKILLLLKEVNDFDGGGWCLRKFLLDGGRHQTWNEVTRWLLALRNPVERPWSELENITEQQRFDELISVAAMNMKKTPGRDVVDPVNWWERVQCAKSFIREQFELYDADLVICCGPDVSHAFWAYAYSGGFSWKITQRGVKFYEYRPGKFVVAFTHPVARVSRNFVLYGLTDAVDEIFDGCFVRAGSGA